MLPKSRGAVTLRSKRFNEPPKIVFNYMSHEEDRQVFRAAIRKARELLPSLLWITCVEPS